MLINMATFIVSVILCLLCDIIRLTKAALPTREEVAIDLLSRAYPKRHIVIMYDNQVADDLILVGLVEAHRMIQPDSRMVQSLAHGNGGFHSLEEDVVLVMLGEGQDIESYLHEGTNNLISLTKSQSMVIFPQSNNITTDHVLNFNPVLWQGELSMIVKDSADNESYNLLEFGHDEVWARCTSADLERCADPASSLGSKVRVAYDIWYPMVYKDDNGELVGLHHDLLKIITMRLNLTVELVFNEVPGAWGEKTENGSWRGLLGMIEQGKADMTASGISHTLAREESFDFSIAINNNHVGLFTKRSSGARINHESYLWEFDLHSWICIIATTFLLTFSLSLILYLSKQDNFWSTSLSVVLRSILNKGSSPIILDTYSHKMILLVISFFAIVINVTYRGSLNSFLAVVFPSQKIKSLQDVLEKSNGLAMWPGGLLENMFSRAENGSVSQKLYERWKSDPYGPVKSYSHGIHHVLDHDYALIGLKETITVLPSYTCEIVQVKNFCYYKTALTMGFAKGSKFKSVFNREIIKLKGEGIIDRLTERYINRNQHKDSECQENQVLSLEFTNVFTPFAILAFGAIAGFVLAIGEFVLPFLHGDNKEKDTEPDWSDFKMARVNDIMDLQNVTSAEKVMLLEKLLLTF